MCVCVFVCVYTYIYDTYGASLVAQLVKNLPAIQETRVQSLSWEDPLKKRNGYSHHSSCLENPMDPGAWQAIMHGVTQSQTQVRD